MGSMNKVFLLGNLGADPEVRYTQSGGAVANMRIATSESWKDAQGERQERTEWHRIVAFGKVAENCGEYMAKGRQILVEGRMQTREWEDKQGVKRYTTEVVADRVTFIGKKTEDDRAGEYRDRRGNERKERGGDGRDRGEDRERSEGRKDEPRDTGTSIEPPPLGDDDIPF